MVRAVYNGSMFLALITEIYMICVDVPVKLGCRVEEVAQKAVV